MGGKRPDQYQIDYDEAGATDYKFYPDQPKDAKRGYEQYGRAMKGRAKTRQPIPPKAPAPGVEQDRAEEMERQDHIHEEEEKRSREE